MEPDREIKWGLIIGVLAVLLFVGALLLGGMGGKTVEEEQGKRNAAATTTVRSLSERHGDDLRILALERHRVEDYDLIGEIFPEFPRGAIGCIIVARAGNQGAVFVEDPQLEIIHEESLDTFIERTRDLDPKLLAAFYLSLA